VAVMPSSGYIHCMRITNVMIMVSSVSGNYARTDLGNMIYLKHTSL